MFIAEPPRTQYDVHFQFAGFDVRVTPFFWIAGAVLGWNMADFYHQVFGEASPGQGVFLLIWIGSMFVSILLHELGHAFTMRYYGSNAYIVLYHFGGVAVANSMSSFMSGGGMGGRSKNQIAISAAGPGIQLALAAVIILAVKLSGYGVPFALPFVGDPFQLTAGPALKSPALLVFVNNMLFINVMWALLNLLPVYPLDGGQIARELLMSHSRDGVKNSLILSVATAAAVAALGLLGGNFLLGIMFIMLAVSSYQILQAYFGRGGGFGGGSPW